MAQILGLGIHVLIIIMWFWPYQIQNVLKTEQMNFSIDKRKTIVYLGLIIALIFIGPKIIKDRPRIITSLLKPRKKNRKPITQYKLTYNIEIKANILLQKGDLQGAYDLIKFRIIKAIDEKNKDLLISFSRLFDLQRKIIFKFQDESRRKELLIEMRGIGNRSNMNLILEKMKIWEKKYLKQNLKILTNIELE